MVNAFPMKAGFRDSLDLTIGEAKASVERVVQGAEESPGAFCQGQDACGTPHVFLARGTAALSRTLGCMNHGRLRSTKG